MKWKLPHKSSLSFILLANLFMILASGVSPHLALGQAKNPYHLPISRGKKELKLQADSNQMLQMLNLETLIPGIQKDIRYATPNNFTGKVLYKTEGLFMRREAAQKLQQVADSLKKMHLAILIFDAYRPYAATLKMWEIVPDDRYAANPANGSGHNRGIAVDLTLIDVQTEKQLAMPTGYDDFSDSAHHTYMQLDSTVLANRALLKGVMEYFGFKALETEWWHYALPNPKNYPLMDVSFNKLRRWTRKELP
jgi:D-alanyl-D-alanine dipeptidase